MEKMLRARYGGREGSFHALQAVPLSMNHYVFTNLEALQTQSSWVFMEASLQSWLIKSLTLGDRFNHQILSSAAVAWGWDWKLQPPNHMVGSPGKQTPSYGGVQKAPHLHNKKHFCHSQQEMSRVLGAVGQELWMKTKYSHA